MATLVDSQSGFRSESESLADVLHRLGDVPPERILVHPPIGRAEVDDLVRAAAERVRSCELIDGVVVEKTVGWYESQLAAILVYHLHVYLKDHPLGKVLAPDGMLEILDSQVRAPDVCFISWARFPDGRLPKQPVPRLVPDLAVEIVSPGNTRREMQRKVRDYFSAGVKLVWLIDSTTRTATCLESETTGVEIPHDGELAGDPVLPGFRLSLASLFDEADRMA